jgi:NADPH:quinone reductase-like Zn-dependent oxidoreductase
MAISTTTQSALVGGSNDDIILSTSAPIPPRVDDDQVAVAVKAIALNPVDTKMLGDFHTPGAVLGCEFSGVITSAGSVATSEWGLREGDRVSGAIMGMNPLRPQVGAFAQHTVAPAHVVLKMRDDWDFAQGSGMGNAWYTSGWALFHTMGLPAGPQLEPLNTLVPPPPGNAGKLPALRSGSKPITVLVSGGSSSTGTTAVQLLKLAGYHVIATCSARNFDLARKYGADEVFDHSSPTCAADIREHTRNGLRFALDCITTPETTRLCYAALGRSGGRYVSLDPFSEAVAATRGVVKPDWVLGPELVGEDIAWPEPHGRKGNPEARVFCEAWTRTLQRLVDQGLVRTHPQLVRETGLQGALGGLDDIRAKKVSGQKLVYLL